MAKEIQTPEINDNITHSSNDVTLTAKDYLSFFAKRFKKFVWQKPDHSYSATNGRITIVFICFSFVFFLVSGKLLALGIEGVEKKSTGDFHSQLQKQRPTIVDRNGEILAQDMIVRSLYAEPSKIIEKYSTLDILLRTLPDLDVKRTERMLFSDRNFVWIKREVSENEYKSVMSLGQPAVGFREETKRQYPSENVTSHLLGLVDVDQKGIAGIESYIDDHISKLFPYSSEAEINSDQTVSLSIDIRAQNALRNDLLDAIQRYKAKAAYGIVMNVKTGEIAALVSLPDYKPDDIEKMRDELYANRAVMGVFEMGSVFKTFTMAMALDSGKVQLNDTFDTRQPLRYGRFKIDDFHPERKIMTVPEVFRYSSNIGTAKIALELGPEGHKAFLREIGLLDRLQIELAESATPLVPRGEWSEISSVTISYGHGISVTPLHVATATAAMINGGNYIKPTLLKRDIFDSQPLYRRVISKDTSQKIRDLLRMNALIGTGKNADIEGLRVGGKTGTAEKIINGKYADGRLVNSFVAAFPMDDPEYTVVITLDEPQGVEETKGYSTAGWNAAPTAGRVIKDIAPILGVLPK